MTYDILDYRKETKYSATYEIYRSAYAFNKKFNKAKEKHNKALLKAKDNAFICKHAIINKYNNLEEKMRKQAEVYYNTQFTKNEAKDNESMQFLQEVDNLTVENITNSLLICFILKATKLKLFNEVAYLNMLMTEIDIEKG
jgi:hypothetical protein